MPKTTEGIIGWLESAMVTTSQTTIGQALFKLINSFLWVVEKCAQWSLPTHEVVAEENGKVFGKVELVRPLPWVLFLPGLVLLRVIRCGLNVGAFILRYPQIEPIGIVKFIQRNRRRLRAMNLRAVKAIRPNTSTTKDKRLSMIEAKKALIKSIKLTLSTLSCLDTSKSSPSPPPTKICISHVDLETAPTPDEKSTTESMGSPIHHDMKRKYSQISSDDGTSEESDNETLESKLDRLALNTSAEDPDFNPNECSIMDSSTSSSESEEDKVSSDELKELQTEMLNFTGHRTNIFDELSPKATKEDVEVFKENEKKEYSLVTPEDEDRTKSNSTQSENTTDDAKVANTESESQDTRTTDNDIINEFINGERSSVSQPEVSSTLEVTNGVVPKKQKQRAPVSTTEACVPPQARTSISKENSSHGHERKGYKHKKTGRRY
ncbi:uncharacterized protein LOC108622511 isoform X2 [Ceratina calcarata]|uniref:Uncharacterized protein LOC108622511 isoform X2 n=1 Tax=Ceratina calcarata TaxID=156304 RepID=A0AAJ7ISN6_9HYME|nr:uncharacterized protein LOC108622511 isoform X2 [Ceratina calcarata]